MHKKIKRKKIDVGKAFFYTILTICVLAGEYYYIVGRLKEYKNHSVEVSEKFSKQFMRTSNVTGVVTNLILEYNKTKNSKYLTILQQRLSNDYSFVEGVIYTEYEKAESFIFKKNSFEREFNKDVDLNKLNYNDSGFYILNSGNKDDLLIVYKFENYEKTGSCVKVFININDMVKVALTESEKNKCGLRVLDKNKNKLWENKISLENNYQIVLVEVRGGTYYIEVGYDLLSYFKEISKDIFIVITMFLIYISISYVFFVITKKNKNIMELKEISLKLSNEVDKRKEVEERYKLAIEASNDVIWEYVFEDEVLKLSDNWKILFDVSQNIYRGDLFACFKEICDEEYYDSLRNVIDRVSRREITSFRIEVEGKNKWMHMKGISVLDDCNNIVKVGGAITDITENKNNEEKIKLLAYNDSLTGLKNSKRFNEDLDKSINDAINNGTNGALLFLDLDDFKKVNDILGHDYGDRLLKQMGITLCRGVDEADKVYRIAGDEFAIIINNFKSYNEIEITAKNIVESFKGGFDILGKYIMTSVSLGVSIFPMDGINTVEIFKNADTAMYKAKEEGKGRYRFFDKLITEELIKKVDMENKVRRAIEKKEFYVYYQPKINIKNNTIEGFEALVRWYSSEYDRWVSPMEFIPVAEEAGFISELGDLVLEEVCRQLSEWEIKDIKFNRVAINVSPIQLNKDNFKEALFNLLSRYNLSPKAIEIEITETAVMQNLDENINILKDLINNGVKISLDDFGTGYSSLSYLINLPISVLKIDRCFINGIDENNLSRGLVEAMIKLSHDINLNVVAEGVEREGELKVLKDLDCDIVQGYYFSKPISKDEVGTFVKNFYNLT